MVSVRLVKRQEGGGAWLIASASTYYYCCPSWPVLIGYMQQQLKQREKHPCHETEMRILCFEKRLLCSAM